MTGIELGNVACTGEDATQWVSARLQRAGLRPYRTFDLRTARAAGSDCTCPNHGTAACDCQLVVLLVYSEQQRAPATVVLHGYQGRTWFMLPEAPDAALEERILGALAPAGHEDS